jgi:hypothetical protein
VASNPLFVLRQQRAALDRAIRALEDFQRLSSTATRKRQEASPPPHGAKLLSMDAPALPAKKVADH